MSSYSLRGLGTKFYRHAFILAQRSHFHPFKFPQSPAIDSPARQAHNGLYDMVKKRTLEARAKMNQQPTDQNDLANQESSQASASNSPNTSSTNNYHSPLKYPFPSFAKGVKTGPNKDLAAMADVCQNTKILQGKGCQPVNSKQGSGGPCGKPRIAPSGCDNVSKEADSCKKMPNPCPPPREPCQPRDPPSPPRDPPCPPPSTGTYHNTHGGGGDHHVKGGTDSVCPGGGNKGMSPLMKALLAVLAGLGLGGLWLLMRSGGEKKEKVVQICPKDEECLTSDKPPTKPTIPSDSAMLPKHVPYLLVGGGPAAFSAFRSIKIHDPVAKVLMVTNEHRKPYMRPPLSKELWYTAKSGESLAPKFNYTTMWGSTRSIFFEADEFFVDPAKLMDNPNGGISVAHGFVVKKIDPVKHKVTLHDGYEIGYDKCLIATADHQKIDWPIHKDFCQAVQRILKTYNASHPLALQGNPQCDVKMKEAIQLLKMLLAIALNRSLEPHEQELTSFPVFCTVCYSLKRSQYVCHDCRGVSYCSLEHAKQNAVKHIEICNQLQLYYCQYKPYPMLAENIPFRDFHRTCSGKSFKTSDLIDTIEFSSKIPLPKNPTSSLQNYQHFVYVAGFSAIATICYAFNHIKTKTFKADKITVYIIGATDEEINYFRKVHTRFFFLNNPMIQVLSLCYIGPEVVNDSGTHIQTYQFLGCTRTVVHETHRGMFQDYKRDFGIQPTLAIVFNCGFSEIPTHTDAENRSKMLLEHKNKVSPWYYGLCRLALLHLVPIFFTSYTRNEAEADYAEFIKAAENIDDNLCIEVCRILNLIQNPFRDIRPQLNWEITDKERIFYRNGYIQGVITEIKERERFI